MNQIVTAPIFQINIHKYSVTNWEEKKPKLLQLLDFSSDDVLQSEVSVHTDYYTQRGNPSYFDEWINILKDDFNNIFNQGHIIAPVPDNCGDDREHLLCTPKEQQWQLWSQSYNEGQYHSVHNHGIGFISCCLYVEFDKTVHKATKFYSPFLDPMTGFSQESIPEVDEGDILLFPSTLLHEATINTSNVKRTVMAFNIPLK